MSSPDSKDVGPQLNWSSPDSKDVGPQLYWKAACRAIAVQFVVVILSALVLDHGDTLQITGVALVGFWVAALMMFLRRPRMPTTTDLLILTWGFLPLVIMVQVTTRLVWAWRGLPY